MCRNNLIRGHLYLFDDGAKNGGGGDMNNIKITQAIPTISVNELMSLISILTHARNSINKLPHLRASIDHSGYHPELVVRTK